MTPEGHYHVHRQDGLCYGDYHDFDWAVSRVAEIQDTWLTTWGTAAMTIIDAPICIEECAT